MKVHRRPEQTNLPVDVESGVESGVEIPRKPQPGLVVPWLPWQAAKIVLLRPGDVYFFSGGTAHTVRPAVHGREIRLRRPGINL